MRLRIAAMLCLWLIGVNAAAQSPAPFLWKIDGPQATHYLLGSVHLLPPSIYPLPSALDHAYTASDVVVLETDIEAIGSADVARRTLQAAIDPTAGGLRAALGARAYAQLGQLIEARGLPPTLCDRVKAWFCAMTLEVMLYQQNGFSPALGIDQHYADRARNDGKPLRWLEPLEDHLALLTQMPDAAGTAYLLATLDNANEDEADPATLLRAWQNSDTAFMREQTEQMRREHPQAYARLLGDRNRAWLPQLITLFEASTPALVIVGAAHLSGDEGLVAQLTRRDFRIQSVMQSP
ncbi:TraB/GumN family protein [Sinimarinibacterium sp. CAU 1509]|uniref:TraB/GumN family protein n=1 Tax=Sinimarinibacterium sp. CAU 1509 TaxID=2562283 RepID=UPI0010AC3685|nr:TraB/GumN family protein [Sinimarinibacterium sp. CAU 1509]TJY60024.1 TraB/GumN family protein [Sinimarinibacterium sp. CAU 1509]